MSTTNHPSDSTAEMLWNPSPQRKATARITDFEQWLNKRRGLRFSRYDDLWQWSVDDREGFWSAVWEYFDIVIKTPYRQVLSEAVMPGATWFPGVELNFVDQVFRHFSLETPAITYESEAAGSGEISWVELQRQTASFARALRESGVRRGDRVAAYLPNIPQTVIAFLAVASIGAIWSVCAPDMGPISVGDRFRQIAPVVLIACDGYRFNGRAFDRREVVAEVMAQMPTVRTVVWVAHLDPQAQPPSAVSERQVLHWNEAVSSTAEYRAEALPGDHPLWILYSSGTTGLPKAIVHGHAGIIANGLVVTGLHNDVWAGDRILWASSTSWMVWNSHVMNLLTGATLVLFDGAVTGDKEQPDWGHMWRLADRQRVRSFGAGAAFHLSCMKAGVVPREIAALSALDSVASTGSPLSPEGYRWLYDSVNADLWINCISGGTDIASAFLGGLPTLPVYAGEMQCRVLGAAVQAFNDAGKEVFEEVGELVCTHPLPSMPLFFWGDHDQAKYLDSYFDTFKGANGENIWRQGDWLKLVPREHAAGGVIYGRSDATINRHGIRMGTAELYRAVEMFDEILDSMVVDLEYLGRASYMVLFVELRTDQNLTLELEKRLCKAIATSLSPRHVPNDIVAVEAIPKTLSGKKLEVSVKKLMLGQPLEEVIKRDAMANPESIDWYVGFAAKHRSRAGAA